MIYYPSTLNISRSETHLYDSQTFSGKTTLLDIHLVFGCYGNLLREKLYPVYQLLLARTRLEPAISSVKGKRLNQIRLTSHKIEERICYLCCSLPLYAKFFSPPTLKGILTSLLRWLLKELLL